MKVTDEQILILKTRIDNDDVTVTQGCKELKIAPVTYYRRLSNLSERSEKAAEIERNVTNMLPITIQTVQSELNSIITELKAMRGKDTREQLSIMDRKINALDKLNNTLKTTQILVDNRTVNVEIRNQVENDVVKWVHDTLSFKRGEEFADEVVRLLAS
jgi:hypothetical protein